MKTDPKLAAKLDKERILEEDMMAVISFCEETGQKLYDSDSFTGYKVIGHATYWARYRKEPECVVLLSGYSHRIQIELEEIWNGRKSEIDLP